MDYFDTKNYKFNTKSKNGIYIIHGFTNSTYETKELAEYLGKEGFYTQAINLPGHGTTPEDCNRVKFIDWIEYTSFCVYSNRVPPDKRGSVKKMASIFRRAFLFWWPAFDSKF